MSVVARLEDDVPDVLRHIMEKKAEHVAACKARTPEADLQARAQDQDAPRGFLNALRAKADAGQFALIAELKKASPSKGLIRADFHVETLAKAYADGGATCLSVLTDAPFFQGADENLVRAKATVSLPCLRKDFLLDPYQVTEARALGADAILIIMGAIPDDTARVLEDAADAQGMDVLVEVHNERELERALDHLRSPLLGVNNRDLTRMVTDLATTETLFRLTPDDKFLVSESGLFASDDLERMWTAGARSFLIGESLMRQPDVTGATRAILQRS